MACAKLGASGLWYSQFKRESWCMSLVKLAQKCPKMSKQAKKVSIMRKVGNKVNKIRKVANKKVNHIFKLINKGQQNVFFF